MTEAVIIDAIRTPGGKRNGMLSEWHPAALAAHVLTTLAERNNLDPAVVDDVIMGCASQVGEQAFNIGRNAVLAAGWPESVPATTVDRACGSSQQALHFAAQGLIAGAYDVVVAAGVESMSRVPMGSSASKELGRPFPVQQRERYKESGLPPQGIGAEMIAEEYGISRADMDAFSVQSHERAARAIAEGRFDNEVVPVPLSDGSMFSADECIRVGTSAEVLAGLRPAFQENGSITAGNSSQISDGASAVLMTTAAMAARLGMTPRARLHGFAVVGADPVTMLKGPIPATKRILERTGMTMDDIDLFEVNEAFAAVVLAWASETGADLARVNVNGGAIALGHPLGSSGTKLTATLLNELERTNGRFGLQIMCEGGGMANATMFERI